MVTSLISLALTKAAIRFDELPLVEMPMRASPDFGLGDHLTNEDVLETDIIADGRNHREIGDQIDRGERRAAGGDRVHELDGDMRCVATRAAVAHGKQPAAVAIDIGERFRRRDQDAGLRRRKSVRWSRANREPFPPPNAATPHRARRHPVACRAETDREPRVRRRCSCSLLRIRRHDRVARHAHAFELSLGLAQFLQNLERRGGLLGIDAAHGKADMNEHPVADA